MSIACIYPGYSCRQLRAPNSACLSSWQSVSVAAATGLLGVHRLLISFCALQFAAEVAAADALILARAASMRSELLHMP